MSAPFRAHAKPSVSMLSVPFFHVGGALGVLGSLNSGNTVVVQQRFDDLQRGARETLSR